MGKFWRSVQIASANSKSETKLQFWVRKNQNNHSNLRLCLVVIASGTLSLKSITNAQFLLGVKHIGGGFSHQCFVPETECIHIDPRVSQAGAATVIQGYSNALLAFSKYAPIKEGDNIVICAGPGGDGLAAIEVAHKIFKANVFVVFTSKSMDALVRDDSAHQAINCNVGLTKVYNFFKTTLNSRHFSTVYDTYDSKLLHVISDL